ncbi:MAG: SDR family oxidoreductase [Bacilli bacterium]|nr:SDR family oxidoreductase [Bacilli bacterium]
MGKKTVLVTGSSIGLGASIIEKFASNGFNCVINYLSHEKEANELKSKLEKEYNIECLTIKADISNDEDVLNMFNEVKDRFNKIDVLVNNAAIAIDTTFEDKTKENFMKIFEVNVYGLFNVSRLFGDDMLKNKNGRIINISSTNGIDTYYEYSLDYDASKAAVINLTHNLVNHYAPYINVNCVCPGWINTPMNKNLDKDFIKEEERKILLNRFADPEEIANLVYFLSTEEASYINDSIIRIDGGKKC